MVQEPQEPQGIQVEQVEQVYNKALADNRQTLAVAAAVAAGLTLGVAMAEMVDKGGNPQVMDVFTVDVMVLPQAVLLVQVVLRIVQFVKEQALLPIALLDNEALMG